MTNRLIQGFDMFSTTNNPTVPFFTEADTANLLGFRPPFNSDPATWFINSVAANEGPAIEASVVRINGKSLRLDRPYQGATYNPQFNGSKHLDFTKTFPQSNRAVLGFALNINTPPETDIPLVQFLYDNGAEGEQLSLWLTPTGRLYIGTSDFDITDDSVQTNTPLPSASTAAGVFRYNRFVYLEIDLSLNATAGPTVRLYVNGNNVLTASGSNFRKEPSAFLDAVSIVNPHNGYWGATGAFTMYLDDIYITTGVAHYGPQHIALLVPSSTIISSWSTTGIAAHLILDDSFNPASTGNYVFNNAANNRDVYAVQDAGAEFVSITAVAPTGLFSIDSGSDLLKLSIRDEITLTQRDASVVIDSIDIEFKQTFFATNANSEAWTNARLDQLQLVMDLS
jgi:hypothetical protein